ncbi:MAG: hypothetical protein MUE60_11470, partial [Candidatus Eisenbacteria bacterium]|nr:hypothetical protein [Candidatus Eisenbacteria bacterium]
MSHLARLAGMPAGFERHDRPGGSWRQSLSHLAVLCWVAVLAVGGDAETWVVTSASNTGTGTLRDALTLANAHTGLDTVCFSIAGGTPAVIRVTTPLPVIVSPVLIDGYSQPGSLPATEDGPAAIAVQVQGQPSFQGFRPSGGCTIRGLAIGGFSDGVFVAGTSGVVIEGNHIGINAAGTAILGNETGIRLHSAGHVVGGCVPAARNVISGNDQAGIVIETGDWGTEPGPGSIIQGNFVGPDATGGAGVGNGQFGIHVAHSADNTLGGVAADAGNTIAFNGSAGVFIEHGVRNGILSNAFYDNGGVGIDLMWDYWDSDPDGVNPNDVGDGDWGANELQNFPVLTGTEVQGASVRVVGTLHSIPSTSFRIEFYSVPCPDGSGHGEGNEFIGATQITTDGDGIGAIDATMSTAIAPGAFVSATATDPLNNTSEFSQCIPFQGTTIVRTAADSGPGSLRNAMVTANLSPGEDLITFAIPGQGPHIIRVASPLPLVSDRVIIDGYTQSGAVEASATSPAVLMIQVDGALLDGDASGLVLEADGCTVRGLAVGGFPWCGILTSYCDSNTVSGNHLGVDATGTSVFGNAVGLYIDAGVGTTVGGTAPADMNVISGNLLAGLVMAGSGDSAQGNYIGTTATGAAVMGNGIGVVLGGGEVLGGASASARNVIAGNSSHGVVVALSGSSVMQNWIGMLVDGTVAGNGGVGVGVGMEWLDIAQGQLSLTGAPGYAVDNMIRENVICGSTGLGIDHYPVGRGVNDDYDSDGGHNYQQNYPVLTQVFDSEGQTTVSGLLASTANTNFVIDFYVNELPDPTNFGEGLVPIGTRSAVTGPEGNAVVGIGVPSEFVRGRFVSCTATDPQGNTSEFGPCLAVGGSGIVTTAADTGLGCLRYAIASANASAGVASITFSIPGTGPHVIRPHSPLPPLLRAITLDGYSQPGTQPASDSEPAVLMIELDGTLAGNSADGITLGGDGASLAGLMVTGFSGCGVRIAGAGNTVRGMWIGVSNGESSLGNTGAGILVEGSGNTIGGAVAASRNIISGNEGDGICVEGDSAGTTHIMGNYIGTDPDGSEARPNGGAGVRTGGDASMIGNGQSTGRNVIAGNADEGIVVEGNNSRIRGNFIGVDAAGVNPLGNGGHGVSLVAADNTSVGGETQGDVNVISANGGAGVYVGFIGSTGNTLMRNLIGTDISGAQPLGNGAAGVSVRGGLNTTVGGVYPELANIIAFNGGDGIEVVTGTGNAILCNSILDNAALGIDLGSTGVTPNDANDSDSGANMLQNFPELATASVDSGGSLTVTGVLSSNANGSYTIRFLWSATADGSGHGEGAQWVGEHGVYTNPSGTAGFTCSFPLPVMPTEGSVLTATATSSTGNTSEFCAALSISGLPVQCLPGASSFDLAQNTPNPFSTTTFIRFSLPSPQDATLSIYDLNGHLVRRLL